MTREPLSNQKFQNYSKGQKTAFWLLLGVVAAYYLWGWHKEHVLQYWPFAIFLMCPLMHLFHGHHGHQISDQPSVGDGKEPNAKQSCH